jgi:hypothetical protein
MKCAKCGNGIECKLSIQTELVDRPIYISYQWWACKSCGTKYFAILEDSRVNIFDDSLEHTGYFADEEVWQKTKKWASKCPKPKDENCKCPVHKEIPPPEFTGIRAWYTNE